MNEQKKNLMDMDDLMDMIANDHSANYVKETQDPRALIEWHQLNNRVVKVYDVNDSLYEDVIYPILFWNEQDKGIPIEKRKKITVIISSFGGALRSCFSVMDVIRASQTPVVTVCLGVACSAGFYIFLAGDKRYMLKNSLLLCHQGEAEIGGTYQSTQSANAQYKKEMQTLHDYVLERCDIPKNVFNRRWKGEFYISDEEAKEWGICTDLIETLDDII